MLVRKCSPSSSSSTKRLKPNPAELSPMPKLYTVNRLAKEREDNGRTFLRLALQKEQEKIVCFAKGSWSQTKLCVGDTISVLDAKAIDENKENDVTKTFVVDDLQGLIIVHPDWLVSGTTVVSASFCARKTVLNERFKGIQGGSKAMLVGTLVHEIFQSFLLKSVSQMHNNDTNLSRMLDEITKEILSGTQIWQDLWRLNMTLDEARDEIEVYKPHMLFFFKKYVLDEPCPTPASSNCSRWSNKPSTSNWSGRIVDVADVEENLWSPQLGLKGKIDVTFEVKTASGRRKRVPLELKTGQNSNSIEHRGQVMLYALMMAKLRPEESFDPEGLLLYLKSSTLHPVKVGMHERRGLIQLRNELTHYLSPKTSGGVVNLSRLPPPIDSKRFCTTCPLLLPCSLYQKVNRPEEEVSEEHTMHNLVPSTLSHLSMEHIDFFAKWSHLCSLEMGESGKRSSFIQCLWLESPSQREKSGKAISDLYLSSSNISKVSVFKKKVKHSTIAPVFHCGDTALVSSNSQVALAQGVVVDVRGDAISLALDKNLNRRCKRGGEDQRGPSVYHLDKLEYQGTMTNGLVNLVQLLSCTDTCVRLRSLIVEKQPPKFAKGLPKSAALRGKTILRSLNRAQQKAVFRTLMAESYVLLHGMPGTGKTTLIVALVRFLVLLGKSVLLTSYTHSAVDTVLLKLKQYEDCPFVRLGRLSKLNPELVPFSPDSIIKDGNKINKSENFDSQKTSLLSVPVVATTCLGLSHFIVDQQRFDYCIVDEAAQTSFLAALGPLFHAHKFVLVGDPDQLPPVVQSKEAKEQGMDCSLFRHLMRADNTIALNEQYRMNSVIMDLANKMTYKDELLAGNEIVAKATITIDVEALRSKESSWVAKALSPMLQDSVVFIDTGSLSNETVDDSGVSNPYEGKVVHKLMTALQKHSDKNNKLSTGVIAPYRAQVSLIRRFCSSLEELEVSTVDQFQGKDRDIIIFSCTRSVEREEDTSRPTSDILNDYRRLNVAVTRAKKKMIFVGNRRFLCARYQIFRKLFTILQKETIIHMTD